MSEKGTHNSKLKFKLIKFSLKESELSDIPMSTNGNLNTYSMDFIFFSLLSTIKYDELLNFIKWNFDIILAFSPNTIIHAESPTQECWLIAENVRFLALMREMNLSAHPLNGKASLLNGIQACSCKYYKFVIMSKIGIWMRQLASCMISHILASVNTKYIDMIAADMLQSFA